MSENIKVQNIGDRRIYYIDVGDMPTEKAMEYLEKIKKELKEKK